MKLLAYIFSIFILIIAPFIFPTYWTMILSEILIMGLFALSFNLLLGYTGLLSFGQAAFFGVGAYTAALLIKNGFENIFLIFLLGFILSAVCSAIVGYLSIRRDEIFFAMLTLGFGMLFYAIAHNWIAVTGGSDGMPVFSLPIIKFGTFQINFYTPVNMYFLILIVTSIASVTLYFIIHSPFGLILKGLRENKERVLFVGGNINLFRIVAFTISGSFAGVSGILFCFLNNMATPEFMHWSFSARPVMMSIIGGTNVFWGPMIGAGIFFILEQIVIQFSENWMFFLGILLVLIVLFFPKGVLGTVLSLFSKKVKNAK